LVFGVQSRATDTVVAACALPDIAGMAKAAKPASAARRVKWNGLVVGFIG
jgi:hypothetical protein